MIYEKFKVLEGINIYEKEPIIYIKTKVDEKLNLDIVIKTYINICSRFNIKSEVNEKIFKTKIEVTIKSETLDISSIIIEKLLNNDSEEVVIDYITSLINDDWAYELREYALSEEIPYIKISEEEIKLGYGIKGIRVSNKDYIDNRESIIRKAKEKLKDTRGLIPIISVTGTNGKTTTVKLIHNMLLELGYSSGLSSTGGIYNNDKVIKIGDTTGFYSAREVLKQDNIEVAVLESARGGILKKGLGYKKAQIAVITSLSEDHIGQEDVKSLDDLLKIKSLILEELDDEGIAIIKAIPILYNKVRHKKNIILFDYNKNDIIEEHIKNKGIAYYVENSYIIRNIRGSEEKLIDINEIDFAFGGISKSNIKNVIVAIISVLKIHPVIKEILDVVKKIKCDTKINLGRQNIIDFDDFKIILDYGHNKEAFEEVFSIAESLKGNRIVGVITAAGDREDKYIKELGKVASKYCDYIIIKEHSDRRGRKLGEVATLLKDGAINNKFDEDKILVEIKEENAVEKIFEIAKKGDIIICFSQFLNESVPIINKHREINNMKKIEVDFDLYH